jgi:flagellum-specific peptidoglycan hydrolase FlgJ
MTREGFISAASAAARAFAENGGSPAGVAVAQAALESNWGGSQLSRDAHNYFGIKAHGSLPWIELPTHEAKNGALVRVAARFARYASMEACFADRERILTHVAAYAEARACIADPEAFICALARHWATDPHYAEKLLHIYREHGLDQLDQPDSEERKTK